MKCHNWQEEIAAALAEDQGGSPELAAAFAARVAEANTRLDSVTRLLELGQTVEALAQAEAAPKLEEMCREVDIPQVIPWSERCRAEGWAVAPPLNKSQRTRLENAAIGGLSADALTKSLRAAARGKDLRSAVWILRKLRDARPGNSRDEQDLRDFERRRIDEIRSEFDTAKTSANEDLLLRLEEEISRNGWVADVPPELRTDIQSTAHAIRERNLLQSARAWITLVSKAYSLDDPSRAAPAVEKVETLLADGALTLPEDLAQEWRDNLTWFRERQSERKKTAEFDAKLRELERKVTAGEAKDVQNLLRELALYDKPLPVSLEETGRVLVENWEVQQARSFKRMTTAIAAGLILLVAIGGWFAKRAMLDRRVEEVASQWRAWEQADELNLLLSDAERVKASELEVWTRPELQDILALTNAVSARIEARRLRLDELITNTQARIAGDINTMPEAVFAPLATEVNQALDLLETQLARAPEEKSRLTELAVEWGSRQQERQIARTDLWRAWSQEFEAALDKLRGLDPLMQPDEHTAALEKGLQLSREAAEPPDEGSRIATNALRARFESLDATITAMEKQLSVLYASATLADYLSEMDTFVQAFPNAKVTPAFQRILERRSAYQALLQPILTAPTDNSFWGRPASRRVEIRTNTEAWESVRTQLVAWEEDPRFVKISMLKTQDNRGTVAHYILEDFVPKEGVTISTPRTVTTYRIIIGARDPVPNFEGKEFDPFWLQRATEMPHCKVLDAFIGKIRFAQAVVAYELLLEETRSLLNNTSVPALLRMDRARELIPAIQKLGPEQARPLLERLGADLLAFDNSIHWLCLGHPHYKLASDKAATALRSLDLGLATLTASKQWKPADLRVEQRPPIWLGFFQGDGQKVVRKTNFDKVPEIWVIRVQDGQPRILIAGSMEGETPVWTLKPEPGEPFFTPKDHQTTRNVWLSLKESGSPLTLQEITGDPAWPANLTE